MPAFSKVEGEFCYRVPRRQSKAVLMTSYRATTVDEKRRQIEDYCRDLIINNDHMYENIRFREV